VIFGTLAANLTSSAGFTAHATIVARNIYISLSLILVRSRNTRPSLFSSRIGHPLFYAQSGRLHDQVVAERESPCEWLFSSAELAAWFKGSVERPCMILAKRQISCSNSTYIYIYIDSEEKSIVDI
jgi:hypothetical protein